MNMQPNGIAVTVDWTFDDMPINQVFGIPAPDAATVKVFRNTSLLRPINRHYKFDKETIKHVLAFLLAEGNGDGLMIYGPHGAGKTSLISQILGRLNWPTLMLSWNRQSDTADLIGRVGISFGNTAFEPGPLTLAARHGYALVINEIDRGDAGNLVALNDLLDGGNLLIKETGEVITPHENFRLICTANSAGGGDLTGTYTGSVRKLDPAFLDRFAMLEADYMKAADESDLMMLQFPQYPGAFIQKIVAFAGETRSKARDVTEQLTTPLSTRSIERFLRLGTPLGLHRKVIGTAADLNHVKPVLDMAYLSRLSPEEREVAGIALNLAYGA